MFLQLNLYLRKKTLNSIKEKEICLASWVHTLRILFSRWPTCGKNLLEKNAFFGIFRVGAVKRGNFLHADFRSFRSRASWIILKTEQNKWVKFRRGPAKIVVFLSWFMSTLTGIWIRLDRWKMQKKILLPSLKTIGFPNACSPERFLPQAQIHTWLAMLFRNAQDLRKSPVNITSTTWLDNQARKLSGWVFFTTLEKLGIALQVATFLLITLGKKQKS